MAATCWDPEANELVHKGHTDSGRTTTETQRGRTVTWRILVCECGAHELKVP